MKKILIVISAVCVSMTASANPTQIRHVLDSLSTPSVRGESSAVFESVTYQNKCKLTFTKTYANVNGTNEAYYDVEFGTAHDSQTPIGRSMRSFLMIPVNIESMKVAFKPGYRTLRVTEALVKGNDILVTVNGTEGTYSRLVLFGIDLRSQSINGVHFSKDAGSKYPCQNLRRK